MKSAMDNKTHRTVEEIETALRAADLRPTRQRVALAELLFAKGGRHISAEMLYSEAKEAGILVSQATVYNALHQFESAGLLRIVNVGASRTYFDTNTSEHHHFYVEETGQLLDFSPDAVDVRFLAEPPAGTKVSKIEVVVYLKSDKG